MSLIKPYVDLAKDFRRYWGAYGGLPALLQSPYVHIAIVFTGLSRPWLTSLAWIDDCLAIVPSILGFSLGAFAIFLAFSDSGFLTLITAKLGKANEKSSLYLQLSGMFAHFMMVQTVAIFIALIGRSLHIPGDDPPWAVQTFSGIGYFAFTYALLTVLASAFSLLRFASVYEKFRQLSEAPDTDKQ